MRTTYFNAILSAITLLTSLVGVSHSAEQQLRLAVLDLDVGSELSREDGKTLADFISDGIVNSGRFEVLERKKIKQLLEEVKFSEMLGDPDQRVAKAGKFLDVNRVLSGRVGRFSNVWTLSLTLVDVTTAKILSSQAVTHNGDMNGLLEVARKAAVDLVMKDPMAAEKERKILSEQWQKQIATLKIAISDLAGGEKKELDQIDGCLPSKVASFKADLEAVRAYEGEMNKWFAFLNRHNNLVETAKATAKNAQEAATKYHSDTLAAAAKYLNDTIQFRHLDVDAIPVDGKFTDSADESKDQGSDKSSRRRRSSSITRSEGAGDFVETEGTTEFANEVFENKDVMLNVGNWIIHQRVGDIMPSKDGSLLFVTQVLTKPTGNQIRFRNFVRFPKALDDARVRQSFLMMYSSYARNLWSGEAAARTAQTQLAALEKEAAQALQKWNSQNMGLKTPQNQVSSLATLTAELKDKLTKAGTERTTKETFLNKPQTEQIVAMRAEISAKYAEKKRQLTEQLATLEAKLKESASQ